MSHPTHSYAPLDSTPPYHTDATVTESHYSPSTPPPLYSSPRLSSNSPPRGAGGYRPETMEYTKQATSDTSSSSAALLSHSGHEAEKDSTSRGQFNDYDVDTSYPSAGSEGRSRSLSPGKKSSHYRGKRWLSFFRTMSALFNIILSVVSFAMMAVVIWGIYAKNKDKWQQPTSNPTDPNNTPSDRSYAFPQNVEPLPNNLIFGASLFAFLFNMIAVFAPLWRSNKKFHKKRFAKSEIFEIIGNVAVVGAGAAGVYFAINTKSDLTRSLWGFTCSVTVYPTKYPQTKLFPDIKYVNACGNYSAAVYTLLGVVGLSAISLGTFLINFCLEKKKGEYRRDDSAFCVGVCDCCNACAGPLVDCLICFKGCLACFQLCS
ncbi:hypothetical protein TWF730_005083 [Orbilia blumenaviensis]|uniref:Uncharacterized protein n=1 Tax=Orbilia blumenaviensis TaxID=1796055 RepID=A0AAV9VJI4_9PEZI